MEAAWETPQNQTTSRPSETKGFHAGIEEK